MIREITDHNGGLSDIKMQFTHILSIYSGRVIRGPWSWQFYLRVYLLLSPYLLYLYFLNFPRKFQINLAVQLDSQICSLDLCQVLNSCWQGVGVKTALKSLIWSMDDPYNSARREMLAIKTILSKINQSISLNQTKNARLYNITVISLKVVTHLSYSQIVRNGRASYRIPSPHDIWPDPETVRD